MARIIQILLSLVCVALAEVQLHLPFFHQVSRLPHIVRPTSDGPRYKWPTHNNVGRNGGYDTWFQHFGNLDYFFNSDSHERDNSYEDILPRYPISRYLFYHGDPYYQGNGWDQMPEINKVFYIPHPGFTAHKHQQPLKRRNPHVRPKQDNKVIPNIQKPQEKPTEIPPADKKPAEQEKGPKLNQDNNLPNVENKLNESNISEVKNSSKILLPKTNEKKKEVKKADKDNKQVVLDKKKDLLIGQENNANNVYLLHENNPNPSITPNTNQPGNNKMYVPSNPGQTNNPVYQVIIGQPASLPTNILTTRDKVGVSSGYNNVVTSPGQATMNVNGGNRNPGYVTFYSNGQPIQIPAVVVNSAPNYIPLLNGNQGLGTNYIIADTVSNNMQNMIQNPDTNVIFASIPNQASNDQINVQVPNCVTTMSNTCDSSKVQGVYNGISNNGLSSKVVFFQANPNTAGQSAVLPNYVSNSYIQPNVANQGQEAITVAIPNKSAVFNNENSAYQLAVELPVKENGYNQPILLNLRQG